MVYRMFSRYAAVLALLLPSAAALAAPAAALKAAPHQAVYKLELDQNRQNSHVVRADGTLTFALSDACDGWMTDQKLEIRFLYAQGAQANVVVNTSSWEAKDGSSYHFTSRTLNNGEETEVFRGKARLTPEGGEAVYSQPPGKTVKIMPGAVFPNQHNMRILAHAALGGPMPSQVVFDGTDAKAQNEVSVFMSRPVALAADKSVPDALRKEPLLQGAAWPTQLAFFPLPQEKGTPGGGQDAGQGQSADTLDDDLASGTPDYELKLDLLPNSVARKLLIDYGHFSVKGTITAVKAIPATACAR